MSFGRSQDRAEVDLLELKLTHQIFLLKSFRFVRPFGSMIQDNLAAPKAKNLTVKTFFFKVISVGFG